MFIGVDRPLRVEDWHRRTGAVSQPRGDYQDQEHHGENRLGVCTGHHGLVLLERKALAFIHIELMFNAVFKKYLFLCIQYIDMTISFE